MSNEFRVGEWLVQPELNQISLADKAISIEPKVIEVLVCLARHAGEVMSKEQILDAVWAGTFVTQDVLSYSVSELRKAFNDDARNPKVIQTIQRRGYRLIAPVVWAGQEAAQAAAPAEKNDSVPATSQSSRNRTRTAVAAGILAAAVLLAVSLYIVRPYLWHTSRPPGTKMVLAVLPFENLARDPDQEYFSDGMTEELITQLGRLQPYTFRVIARTTAMQYKNTQKKVDQIGLDLGANYVLEGSVRREGNRVRVSAQLIRVDDQTHMWAESYDRELSGIIAVQNEVAKEVARQIRITLSDAERLRLDNPRPVVPEAHEAYLKGRFIWFRRTPQSLRQAIRYFEEAIKADPTYAAPYTGLADTYILLNEYSDMPPAEAFGRAEEAASKALQIDSSLAEAHASRAMIQYCRDWDWPAAEKTFQESIALNPNYPTAHHWYSNLLSTQGRLEEACTEIQKAIELDRLYVIPRVALAWRVYAAMRKYDLAIKAAQKVLEFDQQYVGTHQRLGTLYLLTGRSEEAIREIESVVPGREAGPLALAELGYAYAVTGRKAEALRIVDAIQQLSQTGYVDYERLALIYTGLGEKDRALDLLEKGLARKDVGMLVIKPDPRFDPLRDQARFKSILRSMKLD